MAPFRPPKPDLVLTWADIERDCVALGRELALLGPWPGLVAVARGGLVPAAIIARVLDLRLIHTVCATSYDGLRRGPVQVLKPAKDLGDGAGWLVIDDIADSGGTIRAVRDLLPAAHLAALYVKPDGRDLVDSFARAVDQQTWIRFPWQTGNDSDGLPDAASD